MYCSEYLKTNQMHDTCCVGLHLYIHIVLNNFHFNLKTEFIILLYYCVHMNNTRAVRTGLYFVFELYKSVYLINKNIVKLRFYLPETTLAYDWFNDFTLILYSLD